MKRFLLAAVAVLIAAAPSAYAANPGPGNAFQYTVATAGAQTSTTGVMAGISFSGEFTPHFDGIAYVTISGNAVFSAAATGILQIRYGSGTAPANNAAATGQACGPTLGPVNAIAGAATVDFSMTCAATGLAINGPYWFDLLMGSSAGTMNVTNVSVSVAEE